MGVSAMSTNPQRFRLLEAARLAKAVRLAGWPVKQFTLDDNGRPVVVVDQGGAAADDKHKNPLDRLLDDTNEDRTS
jgi:hypothetical protein